MRWTDKLRLRLRSLFRRARVERDLDDELRAHLEHETDALLAAGLSAADARERARRTIGGVDQVKEACRDTRRVRPIENLAQDLRYGVRQLRQNPGFTLVALASLALGIGATTAIFSVVYAVLLRPLPFRDPDRLVFVRELIPSITPNPITVPAPDTLAFARATSFEQTATMNRVAWDLSGVSTPERLQGLRVSPSFFALLGVWPVHGRAFVDADDRPGQRLAIVSHGVWQRQFNGNPAMVGRTILLDRQPYEVVGVMPAGFVFPIGGMGGDGPADVFVPLALTQEERNAKGDNFDFDMLARLRAGVSLERAGAEVQVIAQRVKQDYPPDIRNALELRGLVLPLFERVVGDDSRRLLALLFGAVALLLAIACANVANMLLSRATGRGRELALRRALGATRGRIVCQLLTESVLLALIGGTLGALVARAGTELLVQWLPGNLPRTGEVRVDGTVLAFAIALSAATGVLFGLAPALSASKDGGRIRGRGRGDAVRTALRTGGADLYGALRDAGKGMGSAAHWNWLRQTLAVTELALALVLLTGAGLLLRSFLFALTTDPGFKPDGAVSVSLTLPTSAYDSPARARAFFDGLLDDLAALPGVQAVGGGRHLPYQWGWIRLFTPERGPKTAAMQGPIIFSIVHRQYFEAVGMPLRKGRLFTPADREGAPPALLVNEAFARQFPGVAAGAPIVGSRIKWGAFDSTSPWMTIVGVVGNVGRDGPDREPGAQIYAAYPQMTEMDDLRQLSLVARTSGDPALLLPAVRDRVRARDSHLPVDSVQTLEQAVAHALAPRRVTTGLIVVFAGAALLLAAIGLYGVLAYAVGQRTQEFGIRLALGAEPRQVLALVLRHGLVLALAGVTIGVTLSMLLGRAMASMLYGIGPFDPLVMTAVPLTLLVVALLACLVPARRAVRVDPMRTLRRE